MARVNAMYFLLCFLSASVSFVPLEEVLFFSDTVIADKYNKRGDDSFFLLRTKTPVSFFTRFFFVLFLFTSEFTDQAMSKFALEI